MSDLNAITWPGILDLLAAHPNDAFSNAEISKALHASPDDVRELTRLMRKANAVDFHPETAGRPGLGRTIYHRHRPQGASQ